MTDQIKELKMDRWYIDCEFDGHNGLLLSLAMVPESGPSVYIEVDRLLTYDVNRLSIWDPWVKENVEPYLSSVTGKVGAEYCYVEPFLAIGHVLLTHLGKAGASVTVIADSPVDIARFCQNISSNRHGGYQPNLFNYIKFEVYDIDCYPTTLEGAIQHNAWWDAMALRQKLIEMRQAGVLPI